MADKRINDYIDLLLIATELGGKQQHKNYDEFADKISGTESLSWVCDSRYRKYQRRLSFQDIFHSAIGMQDGDTNYPGILLFGLKVEDEPVYSAPKGR